MRRLVILALSLSLSFAAPSVLAASREAKERAAKKACLNGDPVKGVSLLTDLYVDTLDPTFIYNQGRCFEQNSRYEEAIGRFREFLRKAQDWSEADKADAQKHIADCQAVLRNSDVSPVHTDAPKAAEPMAPAPQSPVQAPTPPSQAKVDVMPTSIVGGESAPARVSGPGSGMRIAGITSVAVGGAALVAGIVLNLKANSMVDDLAPHYNKGTDSSSKTYKTFSMVGYGVGAAGIAGGAVLYYLGRRVGSGAQLALAPSLEPGSAGAVLIGVF